MIDEKKFDKKFEEELAELIATLEAEMAALMVADLSRREGLIRKIAWLRRFADEIEAFLFRMEKSIGWESSEAKEG